VNTELRIIANKASLSFYEDSNKIEIKSKFTLSNKSNIGTLFLSILSLSVAYILIFETTFDLVVLIGIIFALCFAGLFILTFFNQITDYLIITNEEIRFRDNLNRSRIKLNSRLKVKIQSRQEYIKILMLPGSGSNIRFVELILLDNGKENRILNFQLDEKNTTEAHFLGSEIIRKLKEKINACNKT